MNGFLLPVPLKTIYGAFPAVFSAVKYFRRYIVGRDSIILAAVPLLYGVSKLFFGRVFDRESSSPGSYKKNTPAFFRGCDYRQGLFSVAGVGGSPGLNCDIFCHSHKKPASCFLTVFAVPVPLTFWTKLILNIWKYVI